jgi:hypothetical protein
LFLLTILLLHINSTSTYQFYFYISVLLLHINSTSTYQFYISIQLCGYIQFECYTLVDIVLFIHENRVINSLYIFTHDGYYITHYTYFLMYSTFHITHISWCIVHSTLHIFDKFVIHFETWWILHYICTHILMMYITLYINTYLVTFLISQDYSLCSWYTFSNLTGIAYNLYTKLLSSRRPSRRLFSAISTNPDCLLGNYYQLRSGLPGVSFVTEKLRARITLFTCTGEITSLYLAWFTKYTIQFEYSDGVLKLVYASISWVINPGNMWLVPCFVKCQLVSVVSVIKFVIWNYLSYQRIWVLLWLVWT